MLGQILQEEELAKVIALHQVVCTPRQIALGNSFHSDTQVLTPDSIVAADSTAYIPVPVPAVLGAVLARHAHLYCHMLCLTHLHVIRAALPPHGLHHLPAQLHGGREGLGVLAQDEAKVYVEQPTVTAQAEAGIRCSLNETPLGKRLCSYHCAGAHQHVLLQLVHSCLYQARSDDLA